MTKKEIILSAIGSFLLIFLAQLAALWITTGKTNNVGRFGLSSDRISKDLDGRAVSLMLNQVWPFDLSQNIEVQVVAKKQVDEYVAVIVEVKAIAAVQAAETPPKEQFSTTTTSKDVPKSQPKMPSKLRLNGRMKLTYELVDNEWYLLAVENLSLRAIPLD
jgi:hypothetical protein